MANEGRAKISQQSAASCDRAAGGMVHLSGPLESDERRVGGPRLAAHPSNAAFRRRFRLTTHEPLTGKRIGLTLWFGSVDAGWTGWPVFKRGMRWTIGGVDADDRSDAAATRVVRHRSFKRALRVGLLGPVYLGGALAIAAALPMVFFIAWLFDGDLREEWETWKQIAADVRSEVWDG